MAIQRLGEAGGVEVLPRRCAPLSPGSIPNPCAVCAFGFPVHTCFHRFFFGFSAFPPALGFLNKSISGIVWSYSASADWQLLLWHCALSPSGDMSRVTKTQIYFIHLFMPITTCLD